MTKVVITDIVHRPGAFLGLLGLLSVGQGLFYLVFSGLTPAPHNPLLVLAINAVLTGITLLIIAKVCFKPQSVEKLEKLAGMQNGNANTTKLKVFGRSHDSLTTTGSEDDHSFDFLHSDEIMDKKLN